MRGRILLLLTASLLPCTAAGAQPLPDDPDPAALEVARLILASTPIVTRPVDVADEERALERSLLYVGGGDRPCDRANPECLAAARAVARQFAPLMGQGAERRRERLLAYQLADRLRPEQLASMAAFFRSADGRAFVEAWRMLWQPAPSPERMREIMRQAEVGQPAPWRDAVRRFRELTAHLPRTQEEPPLIAPPSPPMPPPPAPRR